MIRSHRRLHWIASLLLAATSASTSLQARADPSELEVYRTEIADAGESNFDMAGNVARTSLRSESNGKTVFQGVGEYAYGLSDDWEGGIKLPVAFFNGTSYGTGLLAEFKYVAAHEKLGFYWGAEFEAGKISPLNEKRQWTFEAVPIFGYRSEHWDFTINPGVTITSAGDQRGVVEFEPAGKVAYQFLPKCALGIEYFSDAGAVHSPFRAGGHDDIALLVVDTKIGKSALNFGIGRGTTAQSPQFIAKAVVDIEFD